MSDKIIELAAQDGIWALLTIALFFYVLKNQEKRDLRQEERESKYQDIIFELTEKLNVIEEIKDDVSEIKNFVFKSK